MRIALAVLAALVFLLSGQPAAAEEYVPLRAAFESLGAQVDWDAQAGTAAVRWNGKTFLFQQGAVVKNSPAIVIPSPVRNQGGRLYVPQWTIARLTG